MYKLQEVFDKKSKAECRNAHLDLSDLPESGRISYRKKLKFDNNQGFNCRNNFAMFEWSRFAQKVIQTFILPNRPML